MMFSNEDQISSPHFDAKGLETVRRDEVPVVSKMMEQAFRIFFETNDVAQVKAYVLRQWKKIYAGRISLKDFIFYNKFRQRTAGPAKTANQGMGTAEELSLGGHAEDSTEVPEWEAAARVAVKEANSSEGAKTLGMLMPAEGERVGFIYRVEEDKPLRFRQFFEYVFRAR